MLNYPEQNDPSVHFFLLYALRIIKRKAKEERVHLTM